MPIIPTYEDHVLAQGSIQSQANPDDFGAQIGQGLDRLGSSFARVADTEYEIKEAQDVTNVHVQMAKARAEWTEVLQQRMRTATPGDDTFAPTFMQDMDRWFEQSAESAQTRKGKRVYQTLAANMSTEFAQQAVQVQATLAGKAARNGYAELVAAGGRTARLDPSQSQSVLASALAAIDDPKGMFSKVAQPVRDEFKRQIQVEINSQACVGFLEKNPNGALAAFGGGDAVRVAPSIKVLQGSAAPGARLDVGQGILDRAPAILAAAADHGVVSGVLAAQADLSGGKLDLQKTSMAMGALLNKYGGDYTKALAAFQMGTTAFDALLSTRGNQWQAALSTDAKNYIAAVMLKGGQMATDQAPENPPADQPAPMAQISGSFSAFNALPGDVQSELLQKGIQFSNLQRSMAMQEKQMQEMELQKQREDFHTEQVKKILAGGFSMKEALASPLATASMLENLDNFHRARVRELKADYESRSNPSEVRRLMLQIHAADGDPTKTYNMNPVDDSYKAGRISTNEYTFLRNEVSNLKNGDSNSFTQKVHQARESIHDAFMKDMVATLPGGAAMAASAYYNAMMDLDKAIAARRAENKDPSSLLDPSSRDYFLEQRHLASYMPSAAFAANVEASKIPYNAAQQNRGGGSTPAEPMKEGTVSQSGKFIWKGGKWVAR